MRGLYKAFRIEGRVVKALAGVDLFVREGEFVTLIGPSGCGKSTLFHIIAGLLEPDAGSVAFDGQVAGHRAGRVAYMMQKDLLLPWRRLLDNVVLAQEIAGVSRAAAQAEARALLALFNLEGFERAYPAELSGGMRQRAALLRTFLGHRDLMLLDEPFGALDALTRLALRNWLVGVWERFRPAILFITHDVEEAVFLSDRVYVMTRRPGRISEEVAIPLSRPRGPRVVNSGEFMRLREHLLGA
ncbi:MAG: ABC transporter ATP-binding protein, partial [Chloroflexota bacterium]